LPEKTAEFVDLAGERPTTAEDNDTHNTKYKYPGALNHALSMVASSQSRDIEAESRRGWGQ